MKKSNGSCWSKSSRMNIISRAVKSVMLFSLTTSLVLSSNAYACDMHGNSGFVPDNSLSIPVGVKGTKMTETQFNKLIDKVLAVYRTEIEIENNIKLKIERNWSDGTVNAYAKQPGDGTWIVAMFGGLARHPEITDDAFLTVVCHELGHHIGGAPKKRGIFASTWASNEGQADYFGVMKCLRRVFEKERNIEIARRLKAPALVKLQCANQYVSLEERAICERSSVAGLALGRFFRSLSKDVAKVDFSTPDKAVVSATNDNHPASQCRVDTYFQASLCDRSTSEDVSQTDAHAGVCTKRNGDSVGLRPNCWYKEI